MEEINIENIKKLISEYTTFKDNYDIQNKKLAEGFNIFEILKIETKETETHSPFIAHLLDPSEEHAQGDFFYKLFLETVILDKITRDKFINADPKEYRVKLEEYAQGNEEEKGRMDISIESTSSRNQFAIVIENKINSSVHSFQLQKYYEDRKRKYTDEKKLRIFYLTLNEENMEGAFKDTAKQNELIEKGILIPITYKKHIVMWLKKALESKLPPRLDYIICQYLSTLKTISV